MFHSLKNAPTAAGLAATLNCELAAARDYDGDTLKYKWEIIREATELSDGGDLEKRPETLVSFEGKSTEVVELPSAPGAYRIFVYVLDRYNHAATANIPFLIQE